MRSSWVAALSTLVASGLGLAGLVLYAQQPLLGAEDTDDPAGGVAFVRDHPEVFANTGLVMVLLSVALTISVASVADLDDPTPPRWPVVATSAAGMFAALCFLVFGAMRVGASGPLLHIAELGQEWGEAAYLVVQMAGVQGVFPAGMLALSLWAVGWSLVGLRSRTIPLPVCILGVVPAVHALTRVLGGTGWLPEAAWLIVAASSRAPCCGASLWGSDSPSDESANSRHPDREGRRRRARAVSRAHSVVMPNAGRLVGVGREVA